LEEAREGVVRDGDYRIEAMETPKGWQLRLWFRDVGQGFLGLTGTCNYEAAEVFQSDDAAETALARARWAPNPIDKERRDYYLAPASSV
jgi:hypothetical protein